MDRRGSLRRKEGEKLQMERIRVVARARGLNGLEKSIKGNFAAVQFVQERNEVQVQINEKTMANFQCDQFVSPQMSQSDFFQLSGAKSLIESALDGYSATIFAYGQTGAGKTYTIFGDDQKLKKTGPKGTNFHPKDGLIPRCADYLMKLIESRKSVASYNLRVTCVEIYNDQVKDLFHASKENLTIRWCKESGFYLNGVTVVKFKKFSEFIKILSIAMVNRVSSSHMLNTRSSRSHCLVNIYVDINPLNGDVKRYGKITIVDLAGSERASDIKSSGSQMKETGHINKSLYTLNKVIIALSSGKGSKFIPFRDSKLTTLLIDSLGGNSKTLMIACVASSFTHAKESARTFEFAMGVALVKNRPSTVLDPYGKQLMELKEEIKQLKEENKILRGQSPLIGYTTRSDSVDGNRLTPCPSNNYPEVQDLISETEKFPTLQKLPGLEKGSVKRKKKKKKKRIGSVEENSTCELLLGGMDSLGTLPEINKSEKAHSCDADIFFNIPMEKLPNHQLCNSGNVLNQEEHIQNLLHDISNSEKGNGSFTLPKFRKEKNITDEEDMRSASLYNQLCNVLAGCETNQRSHVL